MSKFFDDPGIRLPRVNEDAWFHRNQRLLLGMVNTHFGRDLLCIPHDYPFIFKVRKNCVHAFLGHTPDGKRMVAVADFRVGAKWANVIRSRWDAFNSFARYFEANHPLAKLNISPLVLAARAVHASTLTAYPDPSVETTTTDGFCERSTVESWATGHAAAAGTTADHTGVNLDGISYIDATTDDIYRAICLFDTSSLTAGATITATVLSLYAKSLTNQDNDGKNYISIVGSTPASNTIVATGDYNKVGDAVTNPTKYATDISINSIATSAYNDWTFNATGISNVSKTAVTKLGFREGHDVENVQPGNNHQTGLVAASADTAGTSNDPKLVVTYTFSTPPPVFIINPSIIRSYYY